MAGQYIVASGVAKSTPFDNTTNGFVSTDVQAAIEEVRSIFSTPANDQNYWVTKNGNDTTGNGSIGSPYLTIGKAITVITDSSPTKRYVINAGPGDYNENLSLKANIFIKGSGPIATRLTGTTLNINDTTWNVASADNRSGFQDMAVNPTCTWDFTAQTNNTDGKLYFFNVRTSGAWTATAQNPINQIIVQDTQFFGAFTQTGMNMHFQNTVFQGGLITVNSGSAAASNTILNLLSCSSTANLTATWTANAAITINLRHMGWSPTSILTLSGASCFLNADAGSVPVVVNRTLSSSAIISRTSVPDLGMFGDGSDGDVSLSSGTTNLSRTMYYNNLTLSSTAIINTNGYKIYVRNTLTMSGTSAISNDGGAGGNASGNTPGTAGVAAPGVEVGASEAGLVGVTQLNNGTSPAGVLGYGNNGGNGGNGGQNGAGTPGGTAGIGGVVTHVPERVVRHDHWASVSAFKIGGAAGATGGGGQPSLLATAGASGGSAAGGGVVVIFAAKINNTSSVGITARGGKGGNGGNAVSGNSGGGAGSGGGGGGQIYIVVITLTALGTLNVNGGALGTGGTQSGSGTVGANGVAGSTGRTTVFNLITDVWTVT